MVESSNPGDSPIELEEILEYLTMVENKDDLVDLEAKMDKFEECLKDN